MARQKQTNRLDSVATTVGAGLGTLLNRVEDQAHAAREQRDATIKSLIAVRRRAIKLLADLGHQVAELPTRVQRRKRANTKKKPEGSAVPPSVKKSAKRAQQRPAMAEQTLTPRTESEQARVMRRKTARKTGRS